MIGWQKWLGVFSCAVLVVSCFMHWAWYPDLEKYFTGFFSQNNYYGKPGMLLSVLAGLGLLCFLGNKGWTMRTNLILGGLSTAYAIASFLKYTSAYDGIVPEKQPGIYLMLFSSIAFLVLAVISGSVKKIEPPVGE